MNTAIIKRAWASLTFRLFFCLTGLIIFSLLLVALLGLRSANSEITDDYDAQLITESIVIWQLTHEHIQPNAAEEYGISDHVPWIQPSDQEIVEEYAQWRGYRIWKDGKIALESDNIGDLPKQPDPAGFSNIKAGKEKWRVYAMHVPEDHMVVEAFENLRNRKILQDDILAGIAVPAFIILPLLALLLYFGIRYGLQHLYVLARKLEARTPNDLARLNVGNTATELRPLVGSINHLLDKLEISMRHEREFVDHAAHELRTPLTALKLQAQLIAKSLRNPSEKRAVDELLLSVNRTARLVNQLLQLSRLSHQTLVLSSLNLGNIAKEVIVAHALTALDKNITLSLENDESVVVQGQYELLATLIGTILENAIKYTPDGGSVIAHIGNENGCPMLKIIDTGPGIPESERSHVFERFYRTDESDQPGSGLGLAIARQIADLMSATIHLDSTSLPGTGLIVRIHFRA